MEKMKVTKENPRELLYKESYGFPEYKVSEVAGRRRTSKEIVNLKHVPEKAIEFLIAENQRISVNANLKENFKRSF